MRLTFTVFGREVWCLAFDRDTDPEQPDGITGGSGHDFERDMNPPTNEEPWYEDRFGFG